MGTASEAGWSYAEGFLPEDPPLAGARQRALEVGAAPVSPGVGAWLRFLAASLGARAVVEVGTGCGVSAMWLLRGMTAEGVLTSVDAEPEHQRLAKEAFAEAGLLGHRARLITGRGLDVLPRLTDAGYDIVFCDADATAYDDYLTEALRLLRPGGVVAFHGVLRGGRTADPAARDPDTVGVRELGRRVRDDDRLVPMLVPVGDGVLAAIKP